MRYTSYFDLHDHIERSNIDPGEVTHQELTAEILEQRRAASGAKPRSGKSTSNSRGAASSLAYL